MTGVAKGDSGCSFSIARSQKGTKQNVEMMDGVGCSLEKGQGRITFDTLVSESAVWRSWAQVVSEMSDIKMSGIKQHIRGVTERRKI